MKNGDITFTKTSHKGISLITLVITIIVIIILAGAVILSLSNTNVISNANEAVYKSNYDAANSALTIKEVDRLIKINLEGQNVPETTINDLGLSSDIASKFKVQNGRIVPADNATEEEKKWFESITNGSSNETKSEYDIAKGVNRPKITAGLTPLKFDSAGTPITTTETDDTWYSYIAQTAATTNGGTSMWANAESKDKSQWVWIPRYAYKIANPGTSTASTIDVIFLKDATNKYVENGVEKDLPEGYIVHPAFTNETATNFANGGWDQELTGIWVAKYEAGFADTTKGDTKQSSTVKYSGTCKDNYTGVITSGKTLIEYPVFKPSRYSYSTINVGSIYEICKNLSADDNIYGFTPAANPHQMKNSEWGAVAYLSHSKYGRNGTEITINNCNLNNSPSTIYAVTGMSGNTVSASATNNMNNAANQYNGTYGKLASTTGNVYGIYDMSGGTLEYIAGYILNSSGASSRLSYGGTLVKDNSTSTKYKSIYADNTSNDSDSSHYSMALNKARKGEAIWETSNSGTGTTSWFSDYSYFPYSSVPFFRRGGFYSQATSAGAFSFNSYDGSAHYVCGFRPVLVTL